MSNELTTHFADVVNDTQVVRGGLKIEDFEPTPHHVLVEPLPPEEAIGSVYIPESFRKKQAVGWVRRISPHDADGLYEVGDLVIFAHSTGQDIELEGKALLILQYASQEEGEILGRIPKSKIDSAA